jgi:flavin-dependent dehydrogenase
MWDVIVVGGGPAGAMAAMKCAEQNLKTLLLEKRPLPRDKVCTGMVMSAMAQNTLKQEFGEIPREVLSTPQHLSGIWFHVKGAEDHQLRIHMPLTWRRDLDYWLTERARQAGAHVWESAKATTLIENSSGYRLKLKRENKEAEVKGEFIIGADGAASVVRKCLFPKLKARYAIGYRECYKADLGLDKSYWHLFTAPELAPYYFSLVHKEEFMLLDLGTRAKMVAESSDQARNVLAKQFGFDLKWRHLWRDGCVEPMLYHELLSGSFFPARNNALLVGDAAGLILPISGEGIGMALRSGLLAAAAVVEASRTNGKAEVFYQGPFKELLSNLRHLYVCTKQILNEKDMTHRSSLLKEAWHMAMSVS